MLDLKTILRRQKTIQKPFLPQKKSKKIISMIGIFLIVAAFTTIQIKFKKIETRYKKTKNQIKELNYKAENIKHYQETILAPRLANLPYAEESGSVICAKALSIRNVIAPYNPAFVMIEKVPYLFFRQDVLKRKNSHSTFDSQIGAISLNESLEQDEKEFCKIDLKSNHAEDPRAILINDKLYLFTTIVDPNTSSYRRMHLTEINPKNLETKKTIPLDLNLQWVEKNWCPFDYQDASGRSHLYFEYQMSPRKLFSIQDPDLGEIQNVTIPAEIAYTHIPWEKNWGKIRGGTPAQKIGDEYLSFFHSSFKEENGMYWYVMGAYTFESKPPFAITRISSHPILFKGIYETPIKHTADLYKRVIFPSGFIQETKEGKKLIHLACGSNDCGIQIVTFDEEKLLESMTPFQ